MKTALALGTFDGVHIGHREVLSLPCDFRKIAVIFPESPKLLINNSMESIMTYSDKCRAIKNIGIDEIVSLNFEKIKDIEANEFLNYIFNKFQPSLISCGFNYRFGKNAEGNSELLKQFCKEKGIILKCSDPVCQDGKPISSTEIRKLLKSGEITHANSLLCEPFSYTAKVIEGDKRGRTIGFPTINQKYPQGLVKLKYGVYKSYIRFDGKEYTGITDIGIRPTFLSDYVISETHIEKFSDDLYGCDVTISPFRYIREEKKFSSPEELKKQINSDINS